MRAQVTIGADLLTKLICWAEMGVGKSWGQGAERGKEVCAEAFRLMVQADADAIRAANKPVCLADVDRVRGEMEADRWMRLSLRTMLSDGAGDAGSIME